MTHHADADIASRRRDRRTATRAKALIRPSTAVAALAVVALTLAACGSSSPSSATTAPANTGNSGTGTGASSATTAASATVKATNSSKFGMILVNSAGMALYTYGPNNGGTTNKCTGACLQAWPAVTVASGSTPILASGVTGTLATAKQADGTLQVTYNGQLLYTFVSDTSPGQVTGNGVASFSVAKVEASSSATSSGATANNTPGTTRAPTTTKAPTTTAASGGGYQY